MPSLPDLAQHDYPSFQLTAAASRRGVAGPGEAWHGMYGLWWVVSDGVGQMRLVRRWPLAFNAVEPGRMDCQAGRHTLLPDHPNHPNLWDEWGR